MSRLDKSLPEMELGQNQRVCPRCDYHQGQPAIERIQSLLDPETFVEMTRPEVR